uniref:SH3 domain-containing protein n=1 Tax=Tetraodon nigroviridis TaxID=99883 RepID=H3DDB8_TETNG
EEERRRTTEQRRRLEKERILKERRDAEERDRKMDEKLKMIEEQSMSPPTSPSRPSPPASALPEVPRRTVESEVQEQEPEGEMKRSLSPSDAEPSSPEPTACRDRRITAEEEDEGLEQEEISENGQEVLAEPEMCVRALYDYQAEDESEISFEPGDIIRDVETVDKAWWRGRSKDGRQGLFPANYVEAI